MNKKKSMLFFTAIFLMGSCNSIPATPASQSVIQPADTLSVPTISPTLEPPTETVTPYATETISTELPYTGTSTTLIESDIPIFAEAQDILYDRMSILADKVTNSVFYTVSVAPSEIQQFYLEELTRNGWIWVYTELGESLVTTIPSPALFMEFKKDNSRLGITALSFGGETIVMAGMDISGSLLARDFIAGIAGGFDLIGSSETDVKQDGMQFSSILLEFAHPTDWMAADQLMQIFETDNAINYLGRDNYCSVDMDRCFVNFVMGSHFDIPVSIRVHSEMRNLTLEAANVRRWEELNSIASAEVKRYDFPEDLALAGSLESIEIRAIALGDGTPAIQRIYRWKQKDVEEFIISTYTLFTNGDVLMEFHTDFTGEEWEKEREIVNHVVQGIKITP